MQASHLDTAAAKKRRLLLGQTAGHYAAFIALGLLSSVLGPTLPGLAANTGAALEGISILFTVRSLGYLVGAMQSGLLYDRYPGHPILGGILALTAVMMVLVPLPMALWVLIVVFLFIGFAEGLIDVGANTLLLWAHTTNAEPFLNGLHFCFGIGAFVGPLIVAITLRSNELSLASYWVLAVLLVPIAIGLFWLPSPAIKSNSTARASGSINYPLIMLISVFFMLYVSAEVSFGGWIFSYADTLNLTDVETAAYLTSVYWGGLTIGRLLSIPLAARLRPRTILISDLLGCLLSMSVIVIWPQSQILLWLGTMGMGLSMASIFPTMLSFAARRTPSTAATTSIFLVGASLGSMSLPWFIGLRFNIDGPHMSMRLILLAVVLCCVLFGIILRFAGKPVLAMQAEAQPEPNEPT